MKIRKVEKNGIICAVIDSEDKVITDSQSALDLLMTAKYDAETKNIVINKKMIAEDFFTTAVKASCICARMFQTTL